MAEVSGIVVAGLAGFGKTMLVAHQLGQSLPPAQRSSSSWSTARAGSDYDRLDPPGLAAAADLTDVRRSSAGPLLMFLTAKPASPRSWASPTLGTSALFLMAPGRGHHRRGAHLPRAQGHLPEVKAHNALVELSRLVEELVRKGRNVAIPSRRPHPTRHRGCHPDPHPRQLPSRDLLRDPHCRWGGGRAWGRGSASTPTSPRCC